MVDRDDVAAKREPWKLEACKVDGREQDEETRPWRTETAEREGTKAIAERGRSGGAGDLVGDSSAQCDGEG